MIKINDPFESRAEEVKDRETYLEKFFVKTDLVTEKYSRHYERQTKESWTA